MNGNFDTLINSNTSRFEGKWIAIVNQKIVKSGDDAKKLFEEVKKERPKDIIMIVKIPPKKILIL